MKLLKRTKRPVLVIFLMAFAQLTFSQQKAMFTQYMFNGLAVNPAYSAIDEALNVTAVARQQWTGFKGAPNTQTLSFHTPIKESNSSVGVMVMRDQIGEVISETGGYLTFAQRVQISENSFLAAGVNAGLSKYVANYSNIQTPESALDPVFTDQNDLLGNFGMGVMLFSDKFYLGVSSPFFLSQNFASELNTETSHKPHYLLQAGYLFPLGEDVKFKPNMLVKYVNGSPMQIDLNANFLLKETIWLGASLRSLDSFDVLAEIEVTPNIQIGYSYDFTTTALSQVERGSHEIMLNFRLPVNGRSFPRCYF
jgi:type IX secretion system PorP/SprF family membrane protein